MTWSLISDQREGSIKDGQGLRSVRFMCETHPTASVRKTAVDQTEARRISAEANLLGVLERLPPASAPIAMTVDYLNGLDRVLGHIVTLHLRCSPKRQGVQTATFFLRPSDFTLLEAVDQRAFFLHVDLGPTPQS